MSDRIPPLTADAIQESQPESEADDDCVFPSEDDYLRAAIIEMGGPLPEEKTDE